MKHNFVTGDLVWWRLSTSSTVLRMKRIMYVVLAIDDRGIVTAIGPSCDISFFFSYDLELV